MPVFKVKMQQWVEEIATVEVEADTAEEAFRQAYEAERDGLLDADWEDGSDIIDIAIVGVECVTSEQPGLGPTRLKELTEELAEELGSL